MDFKLPLHPLLEAHRQEIEATLRPCLRITATAAETKLWQSKFGGLPYIPLDFSSEELFGYPVKGQEFFPYPRNKETGEELRMLAQLNFEEITHIESFPEKGILQIFINVAGGMKKKNKTSQTDFRIIYYPTIDQDESKLWTDFSNLKQLGSGEGNSEFRLEFDQSFEPISLSDYRFGDGPLEDFANAFYNDGNYNYDATTAYTSLIDINNKIGGYHHTRDFTDPRLGYFNEEEESILLFQMNEQTLETGGYGLVNFFIKKKDLENLDFSNVIYRWDCT